MSKAYLHSITLSVITLGLGCTTTEGEDTESSLQAREDYSLASCEVTIDSDWNIDGETESIKINVYDSRENHVSEGDDTDADGLIDIVRTWSYRDDDQVGQSEIRYQEGGEVQQRGIYEYDEEGRLIFQETYYPAVDASFNRSYFGYDELGFLNLQEVDESGDGTLNYSWHWVNDAEGRVLSGELLYHEFFRCQFEVAFVNTWDELGHLAEVHAEYFVPETDEVVYEEIWRYSYDVNGNPLHAEQDWNGEIFYIESWARNAQGDPLVHEVDWRADGVDHRETFGYNGYGDLVREDLDSNADGILELVVTYTYDSLGRPLRTEHDASGDGLEFEPEDGQIHSQLTLDYSYECL